MSATIKTAFLVKLKLLSHSCIDRKISRQEVFIVLLYSVHSHNLNRLSH